MIGIDHQPFVHVFSRDRDIVGDATYTLTYDVHPLVEAKKTIPSAQVNRVMPR